MGAIPSRSSGCDDSIPPDAIIVSHSISPIAGTRLTSASRSEKVFDKDGC